MNVKNNDYYYDQDEFIIEDYDQKKVFSSFLPGLAGKKGIPMWAFYVNRGQGITSFGIKDKNSPILEFSPAVTAYQQVNRVGFRTFIKLDGEVTEIFGVRRKNVKRKMHIKRGQFKLTETNEQLGLEIQVTYFGLPEEDLASLMRKVTIKNLTDQNRTIELVDGLTQILPYGVENGNFKEMANLVKSWMDVYNLENNAPFYTLRSTTSDSAEVGTIEKGNFYLSFSEGKLLKPIVDTQLIFDYDHSLSEPENFTRNSVETILSAEQVTVNKIPCGFSVVSVDLEAHETYCLNTMIGHVHSMDALNKKVERFTSEGYFDLKETQSEVVIDEIVSSVETKTAFNVFDEYVKQNFLDNVLRGGYPIVFETKNENHVYHIYSRRHGDLERDYNFFSLAPEYYSQGNGNFRDVAQNRRTDSLFNTKIYDYNVKVFASLIQLDGYNPLGVLGSSFTLKEPHKASEIVKTNFDSQHELMERILSGKFTPGKILNTMKNYNITSGKTDDELLNDLFSVSVQHIEADFGEGFWSDHWTYILDLVENYFAIYPDKERDSLFNKHDYKYFLSPATVLPRDEKTVITKDGNVRRYGSILHHDQEKIDRLAIDPSKANWVTDASGDEIKTNLYSKLLVLAVNKFALLDPYGIGIEMEANKPGWNDAMNGLPGIFGSGISETLELKKLLNYLEQVGDKYKQEQLVFPAEFVAFKEELFKELKINQSDFIYWDRVSHIRETYRSDVRFNVEENTQQVVVKSILELVDLMQSKVARAIEKALQLGDGIIPTFLYYEVTKHEPILENGKPKISHYGLPLTRAQEFELRMLPKFLEGPARALKVLDNQSVKLKMYQKIKESDIYDSTLKQYKTSECLDEISLEVGRIRAFTKGWLERESNFLHMSYKYLLGLLKGELYDAFFEELKTGFVAFMDPNVYGRSTLENSSFIAPTCNPDQMTHGQGFVARLSGSTVEALNIWTLMMFGSKPFMLIDDTLHLRFKPVLTSEFFDKNNEVSFTFLSDVKVTYVNPRRVNTFEEFDIDKIELVNKKEVKEVKSIISQDAIDVRNLKYNLIRVTLK